MKICNLGSFGTANKQFFFTNACLESLCILTHIISGLIKLCYPLSVSKKEVKSQGLVLFLLKRYDLLYHVYHFISDLDPCCITSCYVVGNSLGVMTCIGKLFLTLTFK